MASGEAPSEGIRLKIRPLLPLGGEAEIGSLRRSVNNQIGSKCCINSDNISRKYRLSNTSALSPAINKFSLFNMNCIKTLIHIR